MTLTLYGCSDNPKATKACKGITGSSACRSCCHDNGAAGYKYLSDKCSCLN